MRNQLKAAIIVEIIVLIIAFGFSIAYFQMGWYRSSHILDVMLVVLWVLVAAVLLVVFRSRSLVREEMVRRFYLSNEWIYNHEIGYAPLSQIVPDRDAYEFVTFAAEALARMSYGFEVAQAPEDFKPEYLISSTGFRFHFVGEGDDNDDKSVVIDQWRGTLQHIDRKEDGSQSYTQVGSYENAKELAHLIEETSAVSIEEDAG